MHTDTEKTHYNLFNKKNERWALHKSFAVSIGVAAVYLNVL